MTSKLELINAALLLLGDKASITLGSDASNDFKSAEILYDLFYPTILAERIWLFALKASVINYIPSALKIKGYEYAYGLPEDYLLISHLQPDRPYEIFGIHLHTSLSPDSPDLPTLFYTHKVSEGQLPAYFIAYLVQRLAALFAMKITNEMPIAQIWGQSSEQKLREAVALDRQSQTTQQIKSNLMLEAHYGDSFRDGYTL